LKGDDPSLNFQQQSVLKKQRFFLSLSFFLFAVPVAPEYNIDERRGILVLADARTKSGNKGKGIHGHDMESRQVPLLFASHCFDAE